ncbi:MULTISPECIES: hypothetical protein [Staphylococcus intermedius group]|uniref:Uncharacterized protein n=1 Tax=Staphylococcus intermedius NCTC 11048 TaxID=1141106 RepID=A0A380G959_STAIN|nr:MULTISPECIES: hypothetical protein [Staphylococcus intermedius group]SUM47679.1 Uncharacterised protein [Staphylococcus intermedius NCTC 11048]
MKYIITIAVILYIVYYYYIRLTANDEVDTFNDYGHIDLNNIREEVSD